MTHSAILDSVPHGDPIGFWSSDGTLNAKDVAKFINITSAEAAKIADIKRSSVRFDERIPHELERHLLKMANICSHVAEAFDGNLSKTQLWIETPNPALGDISPKAMMRFGRYKMLLKFVLDAKENSRP